MGDDKIPNRANWLFDSEKGTDIVSDKQSLIKHYVRMMLSQTVEMFEYGNLPESIPQKEIEILHQVNGNCVWCKAPDKSGKEQLFVFYGSLGGILNEYYHPTKAIVNNPYLNFNKNMEIGKDCVVTFNNKLRESLLPIMNKYAVLCAECDISIRFATVNARIPYLIGANDDNTRESVKDVIDKIWDGTEFGIVLNKRLLESNKDSMFTSEFGTRSQSTIKDLIELKQYLKSSWYLDLGIQSNYNMKRESLNSNETQMDEDVLLPLIDDMLKSRQDGIEEVNKMFGTNITVKLSSSWEKLREEIRIELKKQETEIQKQKETKSGEDSTETSGKEDGEDEKETN